MAFSVRTKVPAFSTVSGTVVMEPLCESRQQIFDPQLVDLGKSALAAILTLFDKVKISCPFETMTSVKVSIEFKSVSFFR